VTVAEVATIAAAHLQRLARQARPTDSTAVAEARGYCREVLESLGYRVDEHLFEYSAAVGMYGTSIGGLVIFSVIVLALGRQPALAVTALIIGMVVFAIIARWAASRGVLVLPIARRRGANLEASRASIDPAVWLVAHIDSKSQPIPLLLRAAGVVTLALAWVAAIVVSLGGEAWQHASLYVEVAAFIGAIPVVASVVGERSPGAIDNASGVAAVLAAAAMLPAECNAGVLITDAEELGLAGARAWCAETTRQRSVVLNCDGVDDTGQLTLMWTRPRAPRLEIALRRAARDESDSLRVVPLVPGVLVDGLAFSAAGWEAVTLSRGSLSTLRRVHTQTDSLAQLHGTGVVRAALVLARAARLLTEKC
jgi:hypothetical protein